MDTAYTDQTIPESYVDNLELLELVDNKIYKLAGTVRAKGPEHFWLHDAVRASKTPSNSAQSEGRQFAGARNGDATRQFNTTQFFMEDVQVTGTEQRSDHIGIEDRFAAQSEKVEKAVAKDIERALLYGVRAQGTYVDGTSTESANREMGGIEFILGRDKASHDVDAAAAALDDTAFGGYLKLAWQDGDVENAWDVFTSPTQKEAISLFTTPNQRNIEAKSRMIVLPVDTIATDYGEANIHLHREVAADDLFVLDTATLFKAQMLAPTTERYAKRGDSEDGAVKAELTLEHRRPENSVFVGGLATS